jgi:predicted short-subunit dehydrogenase-like oxidoreductase (DUF2520 family)
MIRVTIIGAGRVGGALALSLPKDRYAIDNLAHHGEGERAAELSRLGDLKAETPALDDLTKISSDVVFITTRDSEIAAVAENIAEKVDGHGVVYHTSGSLSSSVLKPLRSSGVAIGSIHPLVSISASELGPQRFRDSFFCVEGDTAAIEPAELIVADLGGRSFTLETRFKTLYHAAAVTACGHLVALFDAAVEMMTKCGLTPQESKNILLPLVNSTVQNLAEQSTGSALTGTFARADIETFTRHLNALNENGSEVLLEIYLLLGERSLELAAKQGVSPARIETLRSRVSIAKSKLKW